MFEAIRGHERQKAILSRQLQMDTFSHAYLFTGEAGIGKRTLAEAFAIAIVESGLPQKRHISLEHADIFKYGYTEEKIGIADVREIISEVSIAPLEGNNRVFLIDHADTMNSIAQNALLKTIEEPQPGNVFILITDNPVGLLETIVSRCQELPFKDISESDKREVLESLGHEYSGDMRLTLGEILSRITDPKVEKKYKSFYQRLRRVIDGDSLEAMKLSEDMAEESVDTAEAVLYLIRELHGELHGYQPTIISALETLFDLYDKLAYNVNLRLQLEGSLIKISMEHNNGKEYSRHQVP